MRASASTPRTTSTDSLFISNYLDRYVRDGLKRVPGVANVIIFGERRFAMRLWLDPNRLAGHGLTATDVTSALREQNVQVAAGSVGAQPSSEDQMYQLSVRAAGRLTEVNEFEDIVVKSGNDGALVRVRDIGRVEPGPKTIRPGFDLPAWRRRASASCCFPRPMPSKPFAA